MTGLIDRRELVAALDLATSARVTIVSAPAGSGKTSLLHAWTEGPGRMRRIAFMVVRPGQHDAQLFWLALLGAVLRAKDSAAAPPSAAPDFDQATAVDRVLSELTAVAEPITIVIDDLHELDAPDAFDHLTALLTNLPPHAHAIIATRRDPPLRLHRLRLAGELAEIRAAQLRFTATEAHELLTASGITLPDNAIATLHERTEGWAAGLRLAALSLVGHPAPERFVAHFSGSERTVAEYLIAEMLERQPAEVQRLLLRTSLLDRVNGELADLLTCGTGSERILLELEDANAFVVSLDADRTWFRYHHLFSGLLRLELRRTLAAEIPDLHRLAASWCTDHGHTVDAIRHLQAAGDWSEAAQLLTDHAVSLTLDGQSGTVQVLLRAFSTRPERDSPDLALVYAIRDLDQMRLKEAAAHLAIAESYAATTPADRRHRLDLALATLQLLLDRLRGNFDGVIDQVESLPPPFTGRSTADIALGSDLRAVALLNLGVTEAWSLRMADSARHLSEGATLAHEIDRPYLEVACRAQLAFASTIPSLDTARRRSTEAIELAARHGWDEQPVIAPALVTLAGTLAWTGEFDAGEQWLNRALRITRAGCEPGLRLLLHLVAGMLWAARGWHAQALQEFTAAGQVQADMAGEHALSARVASCTLATQARLGMLLEARELLSVLGDRQAGKGEIRTAAAAIRLAENNPAAARRELQAVLNDDAPVSHTFTLVEAHLLDAQAGKALDEPEATRAALERALELAEPERLILPFALTAGAGLLKMLPPQDTSHAALVSDVLDAVAGTAPARPDRAAPHPAEELSPSELRLLRYLPTNLTRPEIARALSVSVNTVNTHIRNIYAKLGVTDRSTAVRRGRELRLLSAGRP
ncbi:LuxR C-terminal-related transcriptional regulator [Nocardia sp. NPDC049707]|uniref:LuxR C-terminal-related transcriptional regulator n=1 Tax=Nocardia sp. NPDC049707 TaxID=3154735 RepID=UPI00342B8ACD